MIDRIELWHERARPDLTVEDFHVQLGCHFEEVGEMLDELEGIGPDADDALVQATAAIKRLAAELKGNEIWVRINSRKALLDSLADQIVTAVGVGYRARMSVPRALTEVNLSNWSKFDEAGQPIFNANGKIAKGPYYAPPDLEGMY